MYRRTSSGYHSSVSDPGTSNGTLLRPDEARKPRTDLKNVKPRVDTGLGLKKSGSGTRIPETLPNLTQKRSEPNLPKHRKYSGTFKVPDLPSSSSFTRNTGNRRSLTRLFSRTDKEKKGAGDIRTPFGSCKEAGEEDNSKRSNFLNKRSITSLSLFSRKEDEPPVEPKVSHLARGSVSQGRSE